MNRVLPIYFDHLDMIKNEWDFALDLSDPEKDDLSYLPIVWWMS